MFHRLTNTLSKNYLFNSSNKILKCFTTNAPFTPKSFILPTQSTVGKIIDSKAAIAFNPKEKLLVDTIQVSPPQKGEVRIKIAATELCHTDSYTLDGLDPEGLFPCVSEMSTSIGDGLWYME